MVRHSVLYKEGSFPLLPLEEGGGTISGRGPGSQTGMSGVLLQVE